jgi:hypothetical protein
VSFDSIEGRDADLSALIPRTPTKGKSKVTTAAKGKAPKPPKNAAAPAPEAAPKTSGKEEFWFRFEATPPTSESNLLQLAARAGSKDFDDQAYKFISTDAAKVTRSEWDPLNIVMKSGV